MADKYKGEPDLTAFEKWKKSMLLIRAKIKADEAKRKREEQNRFDNEARNIKNADAKARLDAWMKKLAKDLKMKKPKKPGNQDRLSDE